MAFLCMSLFIIYSLGSPLMFVPLTLTWAETPRGATFGTHCQKPLASSCPSSWCRLPSGGFTGYISFFFPSLFLWGLNAILHLKSLRFRVFWPPAGLCGTWQSVNQSDFTCICWIFIYNILKVLFVRKVDVWVSFPTSQILTHSDAVPPILQSQSFSIIQVGNDPQKFTFLTIRTFR